jgi:hypothetical protein
MDDDFNKNLKLRRQIDEQKDKEYKLASRKRLFDICKKKIQTTMIGALDTIEKKLGQFWTPEDGDRPTNEQLAVKMVYDEVRREILDRGNHQIRNLETELAQYEVEWKRYTLQLPVIKIGEID